MDVITSIEQVMPAWLTTILEQAGVLSRGNPFSVSSFIRIFFYLHNASRAIDGNALPTRNACCGAGNANHRWNAVFTSDNGTVRHGSSHLHHQTARREKERRPARVGRRSYQNFTWLHICALRVQDDARSRRHYPD